MAKFIGGGVFKFQKTTFKYLFLHFFEKNVEKIKLYMLDKNC